MAKSKNEAKELQKLLAELERREQLEGYSKDFSSFAEEQIKIITKDSTQGFVPFRFKRSSALHYRAVNQTDRRDWKGTCYYPQGPSAGY